MVRKMIPRTFIEFIQRGEKEDIRLDIRGVPQGGQTTERTIREAVYGSHNLSDRPKPDSPRHEQCGEMDVGLRRGRLYVR
jgi:hypothetical protein